MIKQLVFVGLGGGLGSILRYLTSVFTSRCWIGIFPVGTFAVNVLGCLLIGLFTVYVGQTISASQSLRLLLITGFCGGYTTFSTFAMENYVLMQQQSVWIMLLYIATSVVCGVLAVFGGILLGESLLGSAI